MLTFFADIYFLRHIVFFHLTTLLDDFLRQGSDSNIKRRVNANILEEKADIWWHIEDDNAKNLQKKQKQAELKWSVGGAGMMNFCGPAQKSVMSWFSRQKACKFFWMGLMIIADTKLCGQRHLLRQWLISIMSLKEQPFQNRYLLNIRK